MCICSLDCLLLAHACFLITLLLHYFCFCFCSFILELACLYVFLFLISYLHRSAHQHDKEQEAVNVDADHQNSAESWGTGRAVSRIPRACGRGTHRAGQVAFRNMCLGGRMFAPTKIWLKWHRKINVYHTTSALAASAVLALAMARGHKISNVQEIPLVVPD